MNNDEMEPGPGQFEAAMAELETIVTDLEQGEMKLEDALTAFEKGVKLTRTCQQILKSAELKVEMLTKNQQSGEINVEPFNIED
mgnify:CR=1 FL=1